MSQAIAVEHSQQVPGSLARSGVGHAHWLLRVALASVFIFHGIGKFAGLEQFAQMMNLSMITAILVALAETGGGVMVLFGSLTRDWITRIGAAMTLPVLVGAIAMVHWPRWSFVPSEQFPMGGMEFQMVLALLALYFVIKGNRV